MDAKDKIIAELRREIEVLKLALAKATKDSSNSSKSPSSDIVKPPKRNAKGKTNRKRRKQGGQMGSKRSLRQALPAERVDESFVYEMDDEQVRKRKLTPTDEFEVIQHVELLDMPIHVTEHSLRKYLTPDGKTVVTQVPELQGRPISDSLSAAHEELKAAIPQQPRLGSDETSLKNNGKKHWTWCITTDMFSVFHIAPTRGRKVLEELIGTDYKGVAHFDYFSSNCSFAWNFDIRAQYCWAHLIREIRFLEKHPPNVPESQTLAERFSVVDCEDGRRYDMSQDYFRFLFEPGVEPTNNHTEQQIRHSVIDRRITQGTRSILGQRYHERMWTAIATCTKQCRSFFEFLHTSLLSQFSGERSPSLLPAAIAIKAA